MPLAPNEPDDLLGTLASEDRPSHGSPSAELASLAGSLRNHVIIPISYFNRLCEMAYGSPMARPSTRSQPPPTEREGGISDNSPVGNPSVMIESVPKEWQPRGFAARRTEPRPL